MGVELTIPGHTPDTAKDDPPMPKPPSRDSPVRWISLGIFLLVAIIFTTILTILIAID